MHLLLPDYNLILNAYVSINFSVLNNSQDLLLFWQPLRRAMSRMGAHNLVPDNMDNCLSYSVVSYLKKLKNQAKVEYEKIVASVGQSMLAPEGIKVNAR